MRLRNKPWAQKLVKEHPEAILNEPNIDEKINWEERFADFSKPLAIEIGSGKGQFITTLAKQHPEMNFIGVELQTTAAGMILRTKLEEGIDNLQLMCADAANIAYYLPENSVDVLYLNFSDPWPKTRHEKRRLTYKSFLDKYRKVLKPEGHLEFKTDNRGLFEYSLVSLNNYGMKFEHVSVDLHHDEDEIAARNVETEYEHKFAEKGNPIYCLHASFVEE
ncbi:tRNA (guanosine(46)-N7)-methyltransferase TrmB [Lactobacillus rodentium]|uniref:tRNA (guanine-N(7)-)-methyltransferase n=1 Tax=Lactobacillus rodentium TaxID=947835 RepID=A0A2Z6T6N3_9LACO|nr:tRNA (guanosine(46)-N7)-methyltransferase TrmB [Lactobacillus rodentium]MCR1894230.1 tRNA (guanosine(46)-N7)-methyltransferase TrmB [Lactobacillus rodentium]GBG04526.1 tRNA (guanine-N(7)-)-methyltransferase [Lactobacillus rodentium]